MRRDAEQNRQRILRSAADVFTERRLGATLDDVARRADVGVGTVYRRFPDEVTLVDALFEERIGALAARALLVARRVGSPGVVPGAGRCAAT